MKKVLLAVLVVILVYAGVLMLYTPSRGSCLDSNTFIESYWNYALSLDLWNIINNHKVVVCSYGCFEGRCITAEEANQSKLPSAPELPPEPGFPVGLD